jgi:hypothetical protein
MEKMKRVEVELKSLDCVPNMTKRKILYDDIMKVDFSQRGGSRPLAASPENPSSQISRNIKRCHVRKRSLSPLIFNLYQKPYEHGLFPNSRKIKTLDKQMEIVRSISLSIERNNSS